MSGDADAATGEAGTEEAGTEEAGTEEAGTEEAATSVDRSTVVVVHAADYLDTIKSLTDDGFTMCVDLCGVDYLDHLERPVPEEITAERFEVVVNLLDIRQRRRVRVRAQVPADEPQLPSLFDLHPGTEAMEREAFDMFGIEFLGHPDLTRILMPEDWVGHPLRKDYDVGSIPVQFKGANA